MSTPDAGLPFRRIVPLISPSTSSSARLAPHVRVMNEPTINAPKLNLIFCALRADVAARFWIRLFDAASLPASQLTSKEASPREPLLPMSRLIVKWKLCHAIAIECLERSLPIQVAFDAGPEPPIAQTTVPKYSFGGTILNAKPITPAGVRNACGKIRFAVKGTGCRWLLSRNASVREPAELIRLSTDWPGASLRRRVRRHTVATAGDDRSDDRFAVPENSSADLAFDKPNCKARSASHAK